MKPEFPSVLTAEEAADILRTSKDTIVGELAGGRIPGFKIGEDWRILKNELLKFMGIDMCNNERNLTVISESVLDVEWNKIDSFNYTWPDSSLENYDEAYETDINLASESYKVKIGYTTRKAAGMDNRYRVIVFIQFGSQLIPVVEFAGANDFKDTHRVASVIKNDDNKQVKSLNLLPSAYQDFPIKIYSDVVIGPYASNGLAVLIDKDNRKTMLHHALIRSQYKGWI